MKRKILFYSENFCGDKTRGGLEVATFRIAQALKNTGEWEVYDAFCSNTYSGEKSVYADIIKLPRSEKSFERDLGNFIREKNIDVVVNMSRFFRHQAIVKAVKLSGRNDVKVIFMQHFAPGSEKKKPTFKSGLHLLRLNPYNPVYWLRSSFYPLLKLPRNLRLNKVYRHTYESSDKVILLSEGYIRDYKKIAGISESEKFDFVPNIFELPEASLKVNLSAKKKRVLILSRMDEIQKRISLALKIWKKIEEDPDLSDWHLDIVGSGHNVDIMKRLVKKLGLTRATYHGWQERTPFLLESSILMMTSEYEGLPLAILEAQAYGVVPIAYDSYASVKDVISDGNNGILVNRFGDIEGYAEKLSFLMKDRKYRDCLAERAMDNSSLFSSEVVVRKWQTILENL